MNATTAEEKVSYFSKGYGKGIKTGKVFSKSHCFLFWKKQFNWPLKKRPIVTFKSIIEPHQKFLT